MRGTRRRAVVRFKQATGRAVAQRKSRLTFTPGPEVLGAARGDRPDASSSPRPAEAGDAVLV